MPPTCVFCTAQKGEENKYLLLLPPRRIKIKTQLLFMFSSSTYCLFGQCKSSDSNFEMSLKKKYTSNIFPALKNPAFLPPLSVNSTFRVTRPSFSSNTTQSPCRGPPEGPGEPEEPLLRSRRASSIRLCFLPANGAACAGLSVFISAAKCVRAGVFQTQSGECVSVRQRHLGLKYLLV